MRWQVRTPQRACVVLQEIPAICLTYLFVVTNENTVRTQPYTIDNL
jgi:hypothetical protein